MTDVIVTAVFRAAPGMRDALIDALRRGIPAVHEEAGCVLYAIHDAADGSIVMLEKWTSTSELDAHADGIAVKKLNELIGPFLAEPVTVTTMTPIPAGTAAQGVL
ncbi:putative quinol monooxygenase [Microbacterium aoyamense]|uniref:Quinol monooxygenase n=1 Tax=Microbacterium aoyamense TaxID=344166 RepID=A0ABN2PYJ5_9MICO|nr:putative quinol monooxygenase [Microbacterium aoyamense]